MFGEEDDGADAIPDSELKYTTVSSMWMGDGNRSEPPDNNEKNRHRQGERVRSI